MVTQAVGVLAVSAAVGALLCLAGSFVDSAAAADASPAAAASGAAGGPGGNLLVYIGGRGPKGGAIYRCRLNLATGELTNPEAAAELPNPSFLILHPTGRFLYSVAEAGRLAGTPGGGVAAFAIAAGTGELTPLNQQPSGGGAPCHIALDSQGKWLLGANYSGGNVFAMPIGADGRLGERTALVQHEGASRANPKRQDAPHAHSINLDAAGRFAFACDLGLDQVLVYRFDADKGTLAPHDPAFVATAPGAGPRHFAFHPGGKWAYVINELDCSLAAYAYDADKGVLTPMQTLPTLPKDWQGANTCAEVQVHPSGRFVYGSNRGHDSIAIFAVDAATGKLTSLGQEPTQGKHPRNFRIDPTGTYLLAANRDTGNVVVFLIDAATGALKPTGHKADVPGPNCVKMLPAKE